MALVKRRKDKGVRKGFQASFAREFGIVEAKLAGVLVPGNRTNLPAELELLFQENGPLNGFLANAAQVTKEVTSRM
jgi:hypothetical protein